MTKEHRVKAMGRVIDSAGKIKDKAHLGDAVRKIVSELSQEEKAFREAAKAEHEANIAKKNAPKTSGGNDEAI